MSVALSKMAVPIMVMGMLITGCSNSLWSKWQDMQCVGNCENPDPATHKHFEQPVYQTITMFIGEILCLVAYLTQKALARRSYSSEPASDITLVPDGPTESSAILPKPPTFAPEPTAGGWRRAALFWLPATCDIIGTTAMNAGLLFIPVSVYQMLRGALVLWVGVFSVLFLDRKLTKAKWASLATVMLGVAVVGASSIFVSDEITTPEDKAVEIDWETVLGVALVLVAQLFTATQFILEEKIMEKYEIEPLYAVGYEGVFGLLTSVAGLTAAYAFYGRTPEGRGGYFDAPQGLHEIIYYPAVLWSSVVIAVSIAFFNACGLNVTKHISATSRSTIDTCRTVGIWAVSFLLGWEDFVLLRLVGFALLVYGTFVFNGISRYPEWTGLHSDDIIPSLPLAHPRRED